MTLRTRQLFLLPAVLLILLSFASLTFAREYALWDPANGIKIRQGYHIEWYRSIARDSDGNLMIAWSDARTGDRDVYVLLLDSNGIPQWTAPVAVSPGVGRQENPHVLSDGAGNWIISWIDYRYDFEIEDSGDIFMMKIDSDGNHLWTPGDGVPVCVEYPDNNYRQYRVESFADGMGGAISIWTDDRTGNCDIYAQHIDANGNIVWTENGFELAAGLGNQGSMFGGGISADSDGAGGVIVAWTDNRDASDIDIYGQRLDVNGNLLWNNGEVGGLPICTVNSEQSNVRLASDGEGGAFLVWRDKRTDTAFGDLYMQRINADGDIYWTENGEVLADDSGLFAPKIQRRPRITNVGAGEAVVVWEDTRTDPSNLYFDLHMQKISGTTEPVYNWGTEYSGLVLCDAENDQRYARIADNGEGGIFVSWEDERDWHAPNQDVYCQLVNSDGSIAWSDNGIISSNDRMGQEGNVVSRLGIDIYASLWFDYQYGSPGIFYQVYNSVGNELIALEDRQLVYGIDNDGRKPRFIKSDDNFYIAWKDYRSTGSSLIYMHRIDLDGNLIWDVDQGTENGISITPMLPNPNSSEHVELDSISFTPDGTGGVIAGWQRVNNDGIAEVQIQRITEDGDLPWGDTGVEVYDTEMSDQTDPFLISDGGSGYMAFFHQLDDNWYQNIVFMRVDEHGQSVWNELPMIAGGETNNYIQDIHQFANNNILVIYKTIAPTGQSDLFAQCVSVDGDILWEERVVISEADEIQTNACITTVDNDIVVVWEDLRRGFPIVDIFGQRISEDGTLHWTADGKELIAEDFEQSSISIGSSSPESTSFWVAWEDNRNVDNSDIYTMRFDEAGDALFQPNSGINLTIGEYQQYKPKLEVMNDNSAYVVWETHEGYFFNDLHFKHILNNGSIANINGIPYPDEGEILCDAFHRQANVQLISYEEFNSAGFLAVWEDLRMTGVDFIYNIYAQKVDDFADGVSNPSESKIPDKFTLNTAYPNPFNPSTTIGYTVPHTANVRLSVYDLLGRQVTDLVNAQKVAGEYTAIWDGHSGNGKLVASGTYFVRLEADGINIAKSVIMLK